MRIKLVVSREGVADESGAGRNRQSESEQACQQQVRSRREGAGAGGRAPPNQNHAAQGRLVGFKHSWRGQGPRAQRLTPPLARAPLPLLALAQAGRPCRRGRRDRHNRLAHDRVGPGNRLCRRGSCPARRSLRGVGRIRARHRRARHRVARMRGLLHSRPAHGPHCSGSGRPCHPTGPCHPCRRRARCACCPGHWERRRRRRRRHPPRRPLRPRQRRWERQRWSQRRRCPGTCRPQTTAAVAPPQRVGRQSRPRAAGWAGRAGVWSACTSAWLC